MCRHAAYIGPPRALDSLVSATDHGLLHQSYAPRELLMGTVCADGYGVAWYDGDEGPGAARYACVLPVWSDRHVQTMLPHVTAPVMMAAVRNATVPGQNIEANCAPFTHDRLSLSHNGYLEDFDAAWRDALRPAISDAGAGIRGTTDSEHIFAMVRTALTEHAGEGALASAVQATCRTLLEEAGRLGKRVQLNLLVSDGDQVVATRCGDRPTQNSLYVLEDGDEFPDATVLASEPLYDDPAWEVVPTDRLVVVRGGAPLVWLGI